MRLDPFWKSASVVGSHWKVWVSCAMPPVTMRIAIAPLALFNRAVPEPAAALRRVAARPLEALQARDLAADVVDMPDQQSAHHPADGRLSPPQPGDVDGAVE